MRCLGVAGVFYNKYAMIYLYLMRGSDRRLRWKTKIGITNNLENRRRAISQSMGVEIWVVTARKMFFSRYYEKALHRLFSGLNSPAWANGGTEWFVCVRWVAFLLVWLIWLFETLIIVGMTVLAAVGFFAICLN